LSQIATGQAIKKSFSTPKNVFFLNTYLNINFRSEEWHTLLHIRPRICYRYHFCNVTIYKASLCLYNISSQLEALVSFQTKHKQKLLTTCGFLKQLSTQDFHYIAEHSKYLFHNNGVIIEDQGKQCSCYQHFSTPMSVHVCILHRFKFLVNTET